MLYSCLIIVFIFNIFKFRMGQAGLFNLSEQLNTLQIILLIFSTFYVGVYLIISNHFIFKPKIQEYFMNNPINSKALYQFLIDALTNLSQLTYIVCSVLLDKSDQPLRIMTFSDMSWSVLCVGIISFKCFKSTEEKHWTLFIKKNAIMLTIIYLAIWIHYFLNYQSILIGIIFMTIYLINLMIDANNQKFIEVMGVLFGYQGNDIEVHAYESQNNMISPQVLAKKFPVKETQIIQKMKVYSKQFKSLKISNLMIYEETRINVSENLMKIALAVQLSRQKMQAKEKRDVKYYFGSFNGTVLQKSKRVILDRKTTTYLCRHSQQEDIQQAEIHQNQHFNSFLFYLFPVKIFQSNKLISILFSIILNFGFGFLLSITLSLTSSYQFSRYIQFLYAILLIPLVPTTNIPKQQFFTSMSLSSFWKYCIYGISLLMGGILDNQLQMNRRILYILSSQILSIILITYLLLMKKSLKLKLIFLWIFLIVVNEIMIFKYV